MTQVFKTHGGSRPGAGRPKGQGRWGEPTVTLRVPESRATQVRDFLAALHDKRPTEVEHQLPVTYTPCLYIFSKSESIYPRLQTPSASVRPPAINHQTQFEQPPQ